MRSLPYWIQRADFSSTEYGVVDYKHAIQILQNHDWTGELAFRAELEAKNEDLCDPGIGFVAGEGEILHVCPLDEGRVCLHYHFVEKRKTLGIIPSRRFVVRSNMNLAWPEIPDVIYHYFVHDHEWLVNITLKIVSGITLRLTPDTILNVMYRGLE